MYSCGKCERIFKSSTGVSMHIKTIREGVRYPCHICNKIYTQEWNLKKHLKLHYDPSHATERNLSFLCNECSMVFKSCASRYAHIQTIHLNRIYTCTLCESAFTNTGGLNRHILLHTGELPFNCDKCNKSFVAKNDLHRHSVCHVPQAEKSQACNICGKKFADKVRLKLHLMWHTGEKHYKCKKCGKTFESSGHLKRHGAVHSDARPYPCTKCSARFGNSDNLRTHIKTHEKFFKKCSHCQKTFTSYGGYQHHRRREHPVEGVIRRLYNCVFCGRGFNVSANLNRHLRSHIGEPNTHI